MNYPNDSRPPEPPPHRQPQYYNSEQPDPWGEDPATQHERQRLAQESARHTKARKTSAVDKITRGAIFLVAALEVLLGLRFVLRFTAANPENTFAGIIYNLSRPFVKPFSTLFVSPTFNGSQNIFDVNLLVAMATYLALLALFLGLVRVFFDR